MMISVLFSLYLRDDIGHEKALSLLHHAVVHERRHDEQNSGRDRRIGCASDDAADDTDHGQRHDDDCEHFGSFLEIWTHLC